MCRPPNTPNQFVASDTRSIGHDASRNRNFSFPGAFPQRDLLPTLTTLGLPKFPQTTMKSGSVAVGGFWQMPCPV
jgi:hypothetical protein